MMGNNSKKLFESPDTWQWSAIGDIAEIITGNTPSKKKPEYYGNYIPLVKPPELLNKPITSAQDNLSAEGAKVARVLPPNSVLVSCIGNLGKTGINSVPVAFNQQINAVVFPDDIIPKFGFYYFQASAVKGRLEELASATTVAIVNKSKFSTIPFPIPSRPEQERIVTKLEETFTQLEAGVAELQNAKAQLKRYRAAVLESAVEGELTREWREAHQGEIEPAERLLARILSARREKWEAEGGKGKYKEPAAPNTDGLPELPEGWAWANHDQLILQLKNGFFGGRPEIEPPGVPLLRISAVRPMSVSYDSLRYIRDITEDKLETYQIHWGDLLFTRYNGNPNLVGACGMVRNVSEPTLYPDKLIRVVVPKELIKPEYLEIYFATNLARSFINPKIKSTAGQNGIAGGDLKDIPVIIPPLKEQQRIVEMVERRLSVADEIEKELDGALLRAERLRGSVLKSAFEGKLV